MQVAVLYKNTFTNKREIMFDYPENISEKPLSGISKPRILTKKQFFNHHYPKIKHIKGIKELAKELYK